jgi:two-component system NarL family sensor kinase
MFKRLLGAEGFERLTIKLLALLGVLILLGGLAVFLYYISLPYAGFEFVGQANVGTIVAGGPAASAGLQVGDRILAMDGMAFKTGTPYLRPNQGILQLTVLHDGQSIPLEITLTSPSLKEVFYTTGHLLVALAFWVMAMAVLILKPRDAVSRMLVLGSLLSTLGIAIWLLADLGLLWAALLMRAVILAIGPILVHLDTIFPERSDFRGRRILLASLYATGLILWLLSAASVLAFGRGGEGLSSLTPVIVAQFSVCVVIGLGLLIRTYRVTTSETSRRQIGLVLLGTALALLPFIVLIAIPHMLSTPYLVPTWLTMLMLAFIPLSYLYAIYRHDLMRLDRAVNRSVVLYLLAWIFVALYLVLSLSARRLVPSLFSGLIPPAYAALIAVLVFLFEPLKQRVKKFVDRIFYGGWYDYETVVSHVSGALKDALDMEAVVGPLVSDLPAVMRLKAAVLLLPERQHTFRARRSEGFEETPPIKRKGSLATLLLETGKPVSHAALQGRLASDPSAQEELTAWFELGARAWVPLVQPGELVGFLVLGNKVADDFFYQEDYHLLATVAQQAAVAVARVRLVDRLQAKVDETEAMAQQIMTLRDRNLQQMALVLQDVLSARICLTDAQQRFLPEEVRAARDLLQEIADHLRTVIFELQPPDWDDSDLATALKNYVEGFQKRRKQPVVFQANGNGSDVLVPKEIGLAVHSILLECLHNARKHAQARQVQAILDLQPDRLCLEVRDDGVGFDIPASLAPDVRQGHLGLVSMDQRAKEVGGELHVESEPGQGTQVFLEVPLSAA